MPHLQTFVTGFSATLKLADRSHSLQYSLALISAHEQKQKF